MLVNDGEMLVNDGEMSVWSYHFTIIDEHSLSWPSLRSCTDCEVLENVCYICIYLWNLFQSREIRLLQFSLSGGCSILKILFNVKYWKSNPTQKEVNPFHKTLPKSSVFRVSVRFLKRASLNVCAFCSSSIFNMYEIFNGIVKLRTHVWPIWLILFILLQYSPSRFHAIPKTALRMRVWWLWKLRISILSIIIHINV